MEQKCVNVLSGLYLISTRDREILERHYFDAVSMPSRAYTSFLREEINNAFGGGIFVSMPSRAYTSFLRKRSY